MALADQGFGLVINYRDDAQAATLACDERMPPRLQPGHRRSRDAGRHRAGADTWWTRRSRHSVVWTCGCEQRRAPAVKRADILETTLEVRSR